MWHEIFSYLRPLWSLVPPVSRKLNSLLESVEPAAIHEYQENLFLPFLHSAFLGFLLFYSHTRKAQVILEGIPWHISIVFECLCMLSTGSEGCSLNLYFLGICAETDISEIGPVRLVDGPNKCAGRVEVLHENRWGSVCDDHWDMKDAKVICKQVGCGSPLSALGGARYGRGPDVIWLDDVNCEGTEESISDCKARPWGEHDCYHGEDASVFCTGSYPSL